LPREERRKRAQEAAKISKEQWKAEDPIGYREIMDESAL
jgi:hypothetical protein